MADNLNIRDASDLDLNEITRIHLDAWREGYQNIFATEVLAKLNFEDRKRRWREVFNAGTSKTLVAEISEGVVGFINFGPEREEKSSSPIHTVGEIMAVYVTPKLWKHGVGTQLTMEALSRMKSTSTTKVVLWVLAENDRAIGFYERLGFIFQNVNKEAEVLGKMCLIHQYAHIL